MPTKSNNMSPMPMQPKIGEASLKFGPDWLRALSSSESPGNPSNSSSGGDSGGRHGFAFSGWGGGGGGTPEGRSGFSSNNKEYSASSQFPSSPSYHQQHHQTREGKGNTPPNSLATRFKLSEHRYTREEMLALYDKNLEAPSFLANFGTLIIEKMQPPMAFSQPLEEEIRIWHSPQPESSRQGSGAAPIGRGFAIRGRGSGVERGRGRGRGGYYGRPHEEEERGSFSRPRGFERSQSVHERAPWGERNGIGGPPGGGPPGNPEESTRGGGSWRTRESFGGRRHEDQNDDGWRKPRWRRGDEDEEGHRNSSGSRRLNRSWSEDENHDNIPEWAKDNPVEESGTFDSSGAFHGEDRSSKIRDFDRKPENDSSMKSRVESEPSGSHNDRAVQKRNPDRNDSVKPVIPAPVREEMENQTEKNDFSAPTNRSKERPDQYSATQHPGHSIIQKKEMDGKKEDPDRSGEKQHHGHIGILESQQPQKQHITNVQHQMTVSHESRTQLTHSQQSVVERVIQQQSRNDMRASNSSHDMPLVHNRHSEEDHYRSMTEESLNLVSKLIEDDGSGSRASSLGAGGHGLRLQGAIPQQLLSGGVSVNPNANILTNNVSMNDLPRNQGIVPNVPVPNIPQTVLAPGPAASSASFDVWFYRDPQGSVQGPFNTHEMAQWYSQGYFSGKLLLRRECDKIFITLAEMGKLYGRNPFAVHPDSPPPPPLQDPNASALEFSRGDSNVNVQAQLQQRQQQLIQQNLLREQQQQFMMNSLGHGGARKEEPGWQGPNIPQPPQPVRPGPTNPSALTTEQMQNQLLMNMAKSQGLEPNAIDQLQAIFHRQMQMKNSGGEALLSQQNQKNDFGDMIPSRHNPPMEVSKSPVAPADPIQSLVQQLTSMANTQHQLQQHKVNASNKPDVASPWGVPPSANPVQPQVQGQWGSHPNSAPWGYGDQTVMKLQQEEELRRRKEEEEAERKRLDDEERKRVEEHKRHERKRLEEQQRLEEEKQRKLREEQYLHQKQQEEMMKQQQEADLVRQKELNRQKEMLMQRQMEQQRQLEQQRQMRDEQTRLAEEQQAMLEEQRLEKERKEQIQAERELKLRQDRERQEQAKMQQFSWNAATPPQAPAVGKTLLEIQQEEAVKQEKDAVVKKKQQQEQLRLQQQQQAQQQKSINLKWAQSVAPAKVAIKSLTEIQAEEQAKLQKAQDKEREKRQVTQAQQHQQQAWSAQLTWANRASINAANAAAASKSNGGVWDDTSSMASKVKTSSNNQSVSSNNRTQQSSSGKKTKELSDDSFMKLFAVQDHDGPPMPKGPRQKQQQMSSPVSQDDFTRWCFEKVQVIGGTSVDIPTFVGFLKEVESPYEVGDYVRSYLGDGKEARDFSREFLERRSRWKNARKDGGGSFEDNLCRPASAINPSSNDFQEVKAKGKKTKKGKMQKVDSRILGFSTSAATDRLNVGGRDYGDGTTD